MNQYRAALTLRSANAKTGPIPISITSKATCPASCAFKDNGCYADNQPLSFHWKKVTEGGGKMWPEFCSDVASLPGGQLWRHNVAGDLPGDQQAIDREALELLLEANFGRRGFTYTHYRGPDNVDAIAFANVCGLTTNLSANSPEEADVLADIGAGPVVCVLPHDQKVNSKTPAGRTIVVCPATVRDDVTCATCGLCYRQRDTIVGFPAHGSRFKRIELHLNPTASL